MGQAQTWAFTPPQPGAAACTAAWDGTDTLTVAVAGKTIATFAGQAQAGLPVGNAVFAQGDPAGAAAVIATPSGQQVQAVPVSFTPANPASTVSVTPVMMGLGAAGGGQACVYTPTGSGKVQVTITGAGQVVTTGSTNLTVGARYGTGTPPANGAANTGTSFGTGSADYTLRPGQAGVFLIQFTAQQTLQMTPGVPFWVDLAVAAPSGANAAAVGNLVVTFEEEAL